MANGCECAPLMATQKVSQNSTLRTPTQASKFSNKDLEQRVAALEARVKELQESK